MSPLLAHGLRAALILTAMSVLPQQTAFAHSETIGGHDLILTASTSKTVNVTVDSGLNNQIRVERDDDDSSCPAAIAVGGHVTVSDTGCDDSTPLRIFVPPHSPVILSHSGDSRITIGDIGASLTIDASGDGSVRAGSVTDLVVSGNGDGDIQVENVIGTATLDLKGDGSARLASVNGKLIIKSSGDGGALIGHISSPDVEITLQGSGDAMIGHGAIEHLIGQIDGSGDLIVSATVKDAVIQNNASGDARLSQVTGQLTKSTNGSGEVHVGGSGVESAIETAATGFAAAVASESDGHNVRIHVNHGHDSSDHDSDSSSHGGSFFTLLFLGGVGYFIYRTLKRNNNWPPRLAGWKRGPQPVLPPNDPGVRSLVEVLSRVESRLVRLENFVTTREFDLHRQFRDLK